MNKAVIFDFNGTLFWDSEINFQSWYNFIKKNLKREYTREEYSTLNGRTTAETLEVLYNKKFDKQTIDKLINEKDEEYLKILYNDKSSLSLAPGAEELLYNLKKNKIKIAIATSAHPSLMVEYEKIFKLSRFFERELIIANDGTYKSKPNPAIYIEALKRLKVEPKNSIVFEDTKSGIISAFNAQVEKIIAVNSIGCNIEIVNNLVETTSYITHFNQININNLF
ncbi:MAG: HAD family hydrolase [Pleomorphochaeta sp.]